MLRGPFRYDDVAHLYTVGGRRVPGISSVLRAGGHTDTPSCGQVVAAMARGRAVHLATLAYDLTGDLPVVSPIQQPFVDAYLEFRAAVPVRYRQLEQPRVNRQRGYAGTPDRFGLIGGRLGVLELKTGGASDWHAIQTAGQALLFPQWQYLARFVVYLGADGRYRLREHTNDNDFGTFLRALECALVEDTWQTTAW